MNFKIAILEDRKSDYESLAGSIQKWAAEYGHTVAISGYSSGEKLLMDHSVMETQILFSDIELIPNQPDAENNGLRTCFALRERGYTGEIIFLTAFREYVFEGYHVQAFQYLVKPVAFEKLTDCLCRYVALHGTQYLFYQTETEMIQIPYQDIISISKDGHDIIIQTTTELYTKRGSLQEIEADLPVQFVRCHRSCIVNMIHVKSVSGYELRLSTGLKQNIGRNYLSEIRHAFAKMAKGIQ